VKDRFVSVLPLGLVLSYPGLGPGLVLSYLDLGLVLPCLGLGLGLVLDLVLSCPQ
jgi:hypothetical protein